MDNYNNFNQGQQYNPYVGGQEQYNPYINNQPQYNPYGSAQEQQYNPYGSEQQQQYNPYGSSQPQYNFNTGIGENYISVGTDKKKFFNLSMILGLVGSIMLLVGLVLPAIDLAHFHKEIDLQYNLFKLGEYVGIKSPMWNVIPYAILAGIIVLVILSFVRIPVFKVLPILLILCMFVLMLVDMENVVEWATDTLDKMGIILEKEITTKEIFKSLMPGIYIMIAGMVVSLTSCFIKIKDN